MLRHWRQAGNLLNFNLEPSLCSLQNLIDLKLYEEEKMKVLREVAEIAIKEYAVQTALGRLDKNIKDTIFTFALLRENEDTIVIVKIPELISSFEEYEMRINVLKTNPYVKNFIDKAMELDKIISCVLEFLNEWQVFQKNWSYFEKIFTQDEIARQLPDETKIFLKIDHAYKFQVRFLES